MNKRRLAELFRQQAEISAEIADALEEAPAANDSRAKRKRLRIATPIPPGPEPDEVAVAASRRSLRALGYPVPPRGSK